MKLLVVDDEDGIREGFASFLRLKGHEVVTASSLDDGLRCVAELDLDLIVSDWRLGTCSAEGIVTSSEVPCVVISGYPQEVPELREEVRVLSKPVRPDRLLHVLDELQAQLPDVASPSDADGDGEAVDSPRLPGDVRDLFRVARELARCDGAGELHEDGCHWVLRCAWRGDDPDARALERLGGDLRILAGDEGPELELRVFADARPDGMRCVVAPRDEWPIAPRGFAVDFSRAEEFDSREFLHWWQSRYAELPPEDRPLLLNLPSHLRLLAETLGSEVQLPKRRRAGPALPEVLSELWG